jgi:protease I
MSDTLKNMKIAILATNGFEQSELQKPKEALEAAGATVKVISPMKGTITGWKDKNWGDEVKVDIELKEAKPEEFEALVLPGGVINPDQLRIAEGAIDFIKTFVTDDKPIAAICHGPWTLINADAVKGKTVTSWSSIKADLQNAGAKWIDSEVVVDGNIITSRKPDDLPAFNREMIRVFSENRLN